MNKLPPSKYLNIRIPIAIPIKGRDLINHGSTLVWRAGVGEKKWKEEQQRPSTSQAQGLLRKWGSCRISGSGMQDICPGSLNL